MKSLFQLASLSILLLSCGREPDQAQTSSPALEGTWQLFRATLIEKGDTTVTDYTGKTSFIKVINGSHFAFLQHGRDKDTSVAFAAGGGRYELRDSLYTEHLEYCNDRNWEGHDFAFTIRIKNDTLVQRGVEKIESAGIDRLNTEEYVRVKQ